MKEIPNGLYCVVYSYINIDNPEKHSCLCWGGNAALSLKEAKKRARRLQQNPYSITGEYKIMLVLIVRVVCQKRTWDGCAGLLDLNTPKNCYAFGKGKIVSEYIDSFPFGMQDSDTVKSLQWWLWDIVVLQQELKDRNCVLEQLWSDWWIAEEIEQYRVDSIVLSLQAKKSISIVQKFASFAPTLLAA